MIGLIPKREHTFTIAGRRTVIHKVSECQAILPREGHTPVIFEEPADEALLGVVMVSNPGSAPLNLGA